MKLKKDAIKELYNIIEIVSKISSFAYKSGIIYTSDAWKATDGEYEDIPNYNEHIMSWTIEDLENLNIDNINKFFIGGSVCSADFEYKGKYIPKPKTIEKAEADLVKKLLLKYCPKESKYFKLEFYDEGRIENCGWEHPIGIRAEIKEKAIQKEKTYLIIIKEL